MQQTSKQGAASTAEWKAKSLMERLAEFDKQRKETEAKSEKK